MGLIDRLTDRAVDPLVEGSRHRRQAREAFRAEVIVALREYSQHIEEMRIAFSRLRDSVVAGSASLTHSSVKRINEWASEDFENYPDGPGAIAEVDERLKECGLDGPQYQEPLRALDRRLEFDLERVRHARTRGGKLYSGSTQAEARSIELDDAWARVRPLLDEALELEAVTYLRSFRHDLQYIVGSADHQLQALLNSETNPEAVEAAIAAIDRVLLAADLWNAHIAGIRNDLRAFRNL